MKERKSMWLCPNCLSALESHEGKQRVIRHDIELEFDDDEFEESEHPELDTNKLYVIGSDGKPQMELVGGERIISIKETKTLINKAKRAFYEKSDSAYKSLGKYLFKIFDGQDNRKPEYVKQ